MRPCILLTMILMLASLACSGPKQRDSKQQHSDTDAMLVAYASRHGAFADWEKSLPSGYAFGAYTFQIEELLREKKTIAARALLHDVKKKDDSFWLSLEDRDMHFKIRATPTQVSQIVKHGPRMYDEYAVIVQVASVERADFEISAKSDPDTGEHVEIESSEVVMITGDCLDIALLDSTRTTAMSE